MAVIALAYSGGLDTSVILKYLVEQGHNVHAVYVDVGQPADDMEEIRRKAEMCGAAGLHVVDKREELCRDIAVPAIQWQAKYESVYLLGTSLARPVITKGIVEVAHRVGADTFAHGATGKGNDQCRFQLAADALDPSLAILAPWRDDAFRAMFPGRQEMIEYAETHGIPVKASKSKPYSIDENCLHVSYESGELEDPNIEGMSIPDYHMALLPENAPDAPEDVTVAFEDGVPIAVNGAPGSPYELIVRLNEIAGRNGVGIIDMVENRFVGMKSRGVYESPGMTVLYESHRQLEALTMDRDLMHLRDMWSPMVAESIYYGFWYCRKMDAMLAFIREAQRNVTGEIVLKLYKGNLIPKGRKSPNSLYDEAIATMEGGGSFNQNDSTGFLRIQGLPLRVQAPKAGWKDKLES